jgi:hypothetical protein
MNAPDCETPAMSHQTRGRDIDVVWPSACVDAGETFIIGVWAPGSVGVQCSYWTLDGQPLEPPCADGTTPTPTATPATPTPTPVCPAGPDPSGGCLPCPTAQALVAVRAVVLSTCPPIVTHTPTTTPFLDIQGDSNCDGEVDATDALAVLRMGAGLAVVVPPPCEGFDGDVDCSLTTNAVDALKILRYSAALSVFQNEPCPDIGTAE